MSASQKIDPKIKKLGILAGGGDMPRLVLQSCIEHEIQPFFVAFEGQADDFIVSKVPHLWTPMGKVRRIFDTLRQEDIRDVILIGSIEKPSFKELKPDFKAIKFLVRYGYKRLGDDRLLKALRGFLEEEGFHVHGAQAILPNLLVPSGVLGVVQPNGFEEEIRLGVKAAQDWGAEDKGQSVLVYKDQVIAREERSGTDAMIAEFGREGSILVKMCKPQQDLDLDLPTIGLQTVRNAAEKGISGIVVHAGSGFFLNREEAVQLADGAGIFIVGVRP